MKHSAQNLNVASNKEMLCADVKNIYHQYFGSPSKYRESPHKTVKWDTEYTVLCEIVLFQIEILRKTVLCETLLRTMRGIEIFQNQSYREISPM